MSDADSNNFPANGNNDYKGTKTNIRKRSHPDIPGQTSDLSEPKRRNTGRLGTVLSYFSPSTFFSLVLAFLSFAYAFLRLGNSRANGTDTVNGVEQGVANQQKKKDLEIQWEQYENEVKAFELEEQRKEQEHSKRMELLRMKRLERMAANTEESNARELELDKQRELEKREADEKFEKSRLVSQRTNSLKNQKSQYQFEQIEAQKKAEQQRFERKMIEERRRNQEKLDDMNDRLASDNSRFQRQKSLKRLEQEAEERRFQQRMVQIQEQSEKEREKMRQRAEQRKSEMNYQLREMYRVLRNRVWNEIIEGNWTTRLNTLRAANRDVETVFRSMMANAKNGPVAEVYKKNLLAALKIERDMMEQESSEMSRMYNETGKPFLLDIKKAVDRVKCRCDSLSSKLNGRVTPSDLEEAFRELCEASGAIPTLAELKKNYRDHMQ